MSATNTHAAERPATAASSPPLKLLLVAGRATVVDPVREALATENVDFRFCADPHEAAILAGPWQLGALLIDLPWAGRAGRELVQKLRTDRRTRHTPVIVIGDMSAQRSREAAERIGADGFACLSASRRLIDAIHDAAASQSSVAA